MGRVEQSVLDLWQLVTDRSPLPERNATGASSQPPDRRVRVRAPVCAETPEARFDSSLAFTTLLKHGLVFNMDYLFVT